MQQNPEEDGWIGFLINNNYYTTKYRSKTNSGLTSMNYKYVPGKNCKPCITYISPGKKKFIVHLHN